MAKRDSVILVDISRDADQGQHPLEGPPRDVEFVHNWLTSPDYGTISIADVTTIANPDASQIAEAAGAIAPFGGKADDLAKGSGYVDSSETIYCHPLGPTRRRVRELLSSLNREAADN